MKIEITHCTLCPRKCGADQTSRTGFCGGGNGIRAARAALHHWEEPCISGTNGSGTVFFTGCHLRCCFCQNLPISLENTGADISPERLAEICHGIPSAAVDHQGTEDRKARASYSGGLELRRL